MNQRARHLLDGLHSFPMPNSATNRNELGVLNERQAPELADRLTNTQEQ